MLLEPLLEKDEIPNSVSVIRCMAIPVFRGYTVDKLGIKDLPLTERIEAAVYKVLQILVDFEPLAKG